MTDEQFRAALATATNSMMIERLVLTRLVALAEDRHAALVDLDEDEPHLNPVAPDRHAAIAAVLREGMAWWVLEVEQAGRKHPDVHTIEQYRALAEQGVHGVGERVATILSEVRSGHR